MSSGPGASLCSVFSRKQKSEQEDANFSPPPNANVSHQILFKYYEAWNTNMIAL